VERIDGHRTVIEPECETCGGTATLALVPMTGGPTKPSRKSGYYRLIWESYNDEQRADWRTRPTPENRMALLRVFGQTSTGWDHESAELLVEEARACGLSAHVGLDADTGFSFYLKTTR